MSGPAHKTQNQLAMAATLAAAFFTGCASENTVSYTPLSAVSVTPDRIPMLSNEERVAIMRLALGDVPARSYTISNPMSDELITLRQRGSGEAFELFTHSRLDPTVVSRSFAYDARGCLTSSNIDPALNHGKLCYGDLVLRDLRILLEGGLKAHAQALPIP